MFGLVKGPNGASSSAAPACYERAMEISYVRADLDEPRHRIAVRELIAAYARDPQGSGRELPDQVLERLLPGLHAHPTSLVFLAFDGDRPAGVAVCFVGFSTFSARPLINVHDLAVLPEYRRCGVGRGLLGEVERHARELECVKITLEVRAENHVALALYRSFGFGDADIGAGSLRTWFLERRLDDAPA
jgi:ribosomal protein S18 acetylase RimI-like enzyme